MPKLKDDAIPVVPLRDMVPQPGTSLPLFVGRDSSKNAVLAAGAAKSPVILVSQKSIAIENPKPTDLYGVGIIAELNQLIEHPDGALRIVITSKARVRLRNIQQKPDSDYLIAECDPVESVPASADVAKAAKSAVKGFGEYCASREDELLGESRQLLGRLNEVQSQIQALRAANQSANKLTDPSAIADLLPGCIHTRVVPEKLSDPDVVKNLDERIRAKQGILSEPDPAKRLHLLRKFVEDSLEVRG
ncbi:MAG: LON peptidase substrate-binding domain-containing protein [Armatimonadetes bacterium]|nr:LON peptidase substrate-binding domain-containing protein [Armatimonadota bacterium]